MRGIASHASWRLAAAATCGTAHANCHPQQHRSPPLSPSPPPSVRTWNDGLIVKLATTIYEERSLPSGTLDERRIGVFGDTLEEAGSTDQDILGHLRQQGAVHVRGCWLVDLLLPKG